MEKYDAIIIGGGPAGSSCGWKLRLDGAHVLIIDRKSFPRDKPCAGWITPPVVDALQINVDEYCDSRTWQPIKGFRCGVIGGRDVRVDYGKPVSFGILRREFDEYLLHRAGARLRLGETVKTIERQGQKWVVNDNYEAPILVGAGGNFCPVARLLGSGQKPSAPTVVAQEVEYRFEANGTNLEGERPALFFCKDSLGYGWCFRKGEYFNVGLGRTEKEGFSEHLTQFREFLQTANIGLGTIPDHWPGHAYRLYDRIQPTLFGEGVLLIGDSAGLANARSGEGIRTAVESGLLAAQVILESGPDYRQEALVRYKDGLTKLYGAPPSMRATDWLPASWTGFLTTRLLANPWFVRKVVIDRWFLNRRN